MSTAQPCAERKKEARAPESQTRSYSGFEVRRSAYALEAARGVHPVPPLAALQVDVDDDAAQAVAVLVHDRLPHVVLGQTQVGLDRLQVLLEDLGQRKVAVLQRIGQPLLARDDGMLTAQPLDARLQPVRLLEVLVLDRVLHHEHALLDLDLLLPQLVMRLGPRRDPEVVHRLLVVPVLAVPV